MKGRITKTGYRRNSPDVNNDFNIIPSNRISMQGVDFPVFGVDNMGNSQMMYPGGEYEFQGDYVTELPAYGSGGLTQWFAEKWVDIKTGKKCGRSGKDKKGRPYPACRPSRRVNSTTPKTSSEMSASEKAKFKRKKKSGKRIDYNHKRKQFGGRSGDVFQEVDTYIKPGQNIRPNWAQTPDAVTNYTFGKNLVDDESRFSLGLQGVDILDEIQYRADALGSVGVGVGSRNGKAFRPAGENLRAGIRGQASWQGVPGNVIENMFGRRSSLDWRGSVEGEAGLAYANGAVRPYLSFMPQTNIGIGGNMSIGIGAEMRGRYDNKGSLTQKDAYSGMSRGSGRYSLKYDMGDGDFIEGYYAPSDPLFQGETLGVRNVFALESKQPRFGVRLRKSFQSGGERNAPLTSDEIFNIPRTVRYENGKMVVQDKPIWDGMLDEVTVTPYTFSEIAWQESMANKATGGLEPVYPIFEVLSAGIKTPFTAGAKALQTGVRKAPSVINPRYFKPNSNMYYRGIGKEGMEDALQSGLFRAKPADQIPARMVDLGSVGKVDMAKRFNNTYYSPQFSIADRYGGGYIAEVPKDIANFRKRYKGSDWSMATKDQIPISEGQILKKDWWSGYKPVKQDGGEQSIQVVGRNGVRKNPDGSESTHLMAREYVDGRGWVAFPTLFQNSDSTWVDMSQDSSWYPIYEEAVKRGEVYDFGENEKAAIKFADEGSWKKEAGGQLDKYQQAGEYKVQSGDTFYGIANRQGVDKQALVKANPGLDIDNLKVGQSINLPGITGPNYALTSKGVVSMSPDMYEKSSELSKNPVFIKAELDKLNDDELSNSSNLTVDADRLRKGLKYAESVNGTLMKNPESSATGFYGQLFSEIEGKDFLKGITRDQFAQDTILQNKVFDERLAGNETFFGKPSGLIEDGLDLYKEYKPQLGEKLSYTPTELAALSNMLGRQGTRDYLGYVLRDGKTLAEALPKIYGPSAKYKNKTPEQYIQKFNEAFKEAGGESTPSYDKYDTLERAWFAARKDLGKGKMFMYGGQKHSTYTPKGL